MELSKRSMQRVVEELHGTIGRDINIMDKTGRIIASTNTNRIGVLHVGARRVITQKLNRLIITEDDYLAGSQNGINLPIIMGDEIAGVVGITGDPVEVEPFGKIIKKMTEILILEEAQKDQKQMVERAKSNFLYSCLFDPIPDEEMETFLLHGKLLGFDLNVSRAAIVVQLCGAQQLDATHDEKLSQQLIDLYKKNFNTNEQTIAAQMGGRIVILAPTEALRELYTSMCHFKDVVEQQHHVLIAGGIGSLATDLAGIRQSYKEAVNSCDLMTMHKNKGIKIYGDVDLELLLQTVSAQTRRTYFQHIFQNCSERKYEEQMTLLRTFFDSDGSVTRTAEQLYIHKNTVQYRLNKTKELTGYDPRLLSEMVPLYVALLIYELDLR